MRATSDNKEPRQFVTFVRLVFGNIRSTAMISYINSELRAKSSAQVKGERILDIGRKGDIC